MSLSSLLKDKNNQDLRDKLEEVFPKPIFNSKSSIKALPLSSHYGMVGTAFDYLLRFYIERINGNINHEKDIWVAELAIYVLAQLFESGRKKSIKAGYREERSFKREELEYLVESQYTLAKKNYEKYLQNGKLTKSIIESAIFLAKLDTYYRSNILPADIDRHDGQDCQDLKNMMTIIPNNFFHAKNKIYFNPTFGKGSELVGGADADLIIDGTLIDIKTSKDLKLPRDHFNQLVSYYILSLIGGINGNTKDRPITELGIYFARYGILWKTSVHCLGNEKSISSSIKWFADYAAKKA